MSAEIGRNVRVWVGAGGDVSYPTGCTGTVTDGPVEEGTIIRVPSGRLVEPAETGWWVDIDGDPTPGDWLIGEKRLFPLDGGEPTTIQDEEKEPATA